MTSELRPAASGWMPIETAPKDGTKAILYFPQDATDFDGVDYSYRIAIYRENAAFPQGVWRDQGTNHDSFEGPDMTGRDKASHWFPLPSAPTADSEAARAEQAAELAKYKALAETLAEALEAAAYALHTMSESNPDCMGWEPPYPSTVSTVSVEAKAATEALRQYKEATNV